MHFLRRFNGSHQWGPKGVWQEAFAWMWLIAMKNGRQPRDEQFITAELIATLQRAKMLEDSGDVFFAWQNDRNASDIFQGLTDTKKIDDHTADMKKNEAVREGQEREEKELDEQIRIQSKVLNIIALIQKPKPKWLTNEQLNNYNVGDLSFSDLRTQAQEAIRRLRKNLEDEDRLERRQLLERARGVIFSSLMETAQFDLDSNDLQTAKNFLELAIEMQPTMYWPHLSLARCFIRMGDKEESIRELGRARAVGLSAQSLIETSKQMSELGSLIDDPEFQKLITDVPGGH
jgi:tetratricopeptide (TPR) repeat protein